MVKPYKIFFLSFIFYGVFALSAGDDPSYIDFIRNKGQWNDKSIYQADFKGGRLFLEPNAFTYVFYPQDGFSVLHPHANGKQANTSAGITLTFQAVRMEFIGSSPNVITQEQNKKPYYHNYYLGKDPSKWAGNVPLSESVVYRELYSGISVKTFSSFNNVRYDFLLSPGADPSL